MAFAGGRGGRRAEELLALLQKVYTRRRVDIVEERLARGERQRLTSFTAAMISALSSFSSA